jgi:hypothetical protein
MEEMAAFKLHRFNRILRIAKVIVLRFPIDDCARERFLEAVPGLLHGLKKARLVRGVTWPRWPRAGSRLGIEVEAARFVSQRAILFRLTTVSETVG